MTRSLARRWRVFVFAAGAALACTAQQDAPKVPLAKTARVDSVDAEAAAHALLGPAAKAALDSGNILFRQKAYAAALAQYRSASALAPQHTAPLFGIFMVARATKDSIMADSAMAGIRLRSGAMSASPHTMGDSALQRMHENLKKKPAAE
jgi:hypothetical protein